MEDHNEAVRTISKAVRYFYDHDKKFSIYHGKTGRVRLLRFNRNEVIDTSALNHVISIDKESKTALVEPNVDMRALVNAALAHNLLPVVVPEFPGLTVGGGFAGSAGESSSFKHGPFEFTAIEIEIVLADGTVTRCSEKEKPDLFRGAAGTCGTLGVVTLLKMKLMDAKPYVELTFHREYSISATRRKNEEEMKKPSNDFIDCILFSSTESVVMVGQLVDKPTVPIHRCSRARDDWFYLQAKEQFHKTTSSSPVFALPIEDYLFRYDRGAFWGGIDCFKYFAMPFNWFTRWLLDPCMHSDTMYHALHRSGLAQKFIIQDVLIPASQVESFLAKISDIWNFYPLSLCALSAGWPLGLNPNSATLTPEGNTKEIIYNVGIYCPRKHWNMSVEQENRMLVSLIIEHHGFKWTYADMYYTEKEFAETYNVQSFEELRIKYNATSLKTVFEKTKTDITAQKKVFTQYWGFWNIWPLAGVYGAVSAVIGNEYLLEKNLSARWKQFAVFALVIGALYYVRQ